MNNSILVPHFETQKALKLELAQHGVNKLFSVGDDSKTIKGIKQGFNTAIIYMTPDNEICPASKAASCQDGCLVSAGRGKFNNVKRARLNKTRLYKADKGLFISALISEITSLIKKHGNSLVIRLNGTSDIDYENIDFNYQGVEYKNIMGMFPGIQFYDYTKRVNRLFRVLPDNYDLTLSYSGARHSYSIQCLDALRMGARIAVVFDDLEQAIVNGWMTEKVIDGDSTDLRFLDPKGSVIGLQAKGDAKKDTSGFIVQTNKQTAQLIKVA